MEDLESNSETTFYKTQLNELVAGAVQNDYRLAQMNNEIRQMRSGLSLIASLNNFQPNQNFEEIYDHFTEQVNVQLQNDLTAVLLRSGNDPTIFIAGFIKSSIQGIDDSEKIELKMPEDFISQKQCLLVNSLSIPDLVINEIRNKLAIKYFILAPVIVDHELIGYLITGRKTETLLFAASRLQLYDVYTLQAISGVISALKKQYNQFEALENERRRIASEMHDELGSKVTHIGLLSELLSRKAYADEFLSGQLNDIGMISRELVESMGEIIWEMNPHHDTLDNVMVHIREQATKFFEASEIKLSIHFPEEVEDIKLSNVVRRNLYLVAMEGLNNVIKHSRSMDVSLSILVVHNRINIIIKDTGKGFANKIRYGANGLSNMIKRMETINGYISWISDDMGTTLYFGFKY